MAAPCSQLSFYMINLMYYHLLMYIEILNS